MGEEEPWKLSGLLKWVVFYACPLVTRFSFSPWPHGMFLFIYLISSGCSAQGETWIANFFFHYCIKSLGIECRCSDSVIIGSLWRDTSCTGAQGRYYISSHAVYIVGNAEFLSLSETLYVPIYQCLCRKKTIICCKLKPRLFSETAYPFYCAFL